MDARRRLRIGQFSLRALFVVLTLSSMPCSVFAYRQMRVNFLCRLVERFNVVMDAQEYDDAEEIAQEARREFPTDSNTEALGWKSQFANAIIADNCEDYHGSYSDGFVCGT